LDEKARQVRFSFALWRGLIYHYFLVKNPERGLFMMRNKLLVWSCVLALVFFLGAVSLAGAVEKDPVVGQSVGIAKFKAPITEDGAKYLGLGKADAFTLKDVKAPYLLVEQFNTSCPHCMAQAPVMNALYSKVQADAQLKDKLKFVGAGQGNEIPQLKMWEAFHKVPFALVPDPDNSFGKALNFTPYPVTVILDKTGKVVFVHIGAFDNADEVLAKIKAVVK
jgi:thiol-disulfide isomerase/thioredoxin